MHKHPHPKTGKTVVVKSPRDPSGIVARGKKFRIADWYDRITSTGKGWSECSAGVATQYSARVRKGTLPRDNKVVYGSLIENGSDYPCLLHTSEF